MRKPRLGSVPYLNARPLLWGLEAELEVPSVLSRRFLAGEFDAALIPVYETLRLPHPRIADGYGICSRGRVHSVVVVHRQPLEDIPEIVLDPASRTSNNLLRILLAERLRISPRLVGQSSDPLAAHLLIGDPAMEFQRTMDSSWRAWDLGAAWHEWTGLPFVFAVWTLADTAPEHTPELLREAAHAGLEARREIAENEPDPDAAFDYLMHSIRYPIGEPEKCAILQFREHLIGCGLLGPDSTLPQFL